MRIVCVDLVQKVRDIKYTYDQPLGGTTSNIYTLSKGFIEHDSSVAILSNIENSSSDEWIFYDTIRKWKEYVNKADVVCINSCIDTNIIDYGHKNLFYICRDYPDVIRTKWMLDKSLVDKFKYIVFVSEYHMNFMINHYRLPREKCRFIHNPIYTPFYTQPRHRYENRFVFISAPCKGINSLPYYINRINNRLKSINPEFYVYSSESLYNHFDELPYSRVDSRYTESVDSIRMLDNVYVRDVVGKKYIAEILKESSILIHPHEYIEACPTAIIESMASGCIPVMGNKGPSDEIITDKFNGRLTERKEHHTGNASEDKCYIDELVDITVDLFENSDMSSYRKNCIESSIEKYNYIDISRKFIDLFKE